MIRDFKISLIVSIVALIFGAVCVWATPPIGTTEPALPGVTWHTILYGHDGTSNASTGYGYLWADDIAALAIGDDLGNATALDVSTLFSGSGDYLKSDGTKGTPSGTGAVTLSSITDWPVGVNATEVGYLDGVTSAIQTQIGAITTTIGAYGNSTAYSVGTSPGQLPVLGDDGEGNGALGIVSIDLPTGAGYQVNGTALDVSDLTDLGGLLVGGITLPVGCVEDDILVVDSDNATLVCMGMEEHPQFVTLLDAFYAAGLNSFNFASTCPSYYPDSTDVELVVDVTDTSSTYAVDSVAARIGDEGAFSITCVLVSGDDWTCTLGDGGTPLAEGSWNIWFQACDDKAPTPNCANSPTACVVVVDETDPIVDLTADDEV